MESKYSVRSGACLNQADTQRGALSVKCRSRGEHTVCTVVLQGFKVHGPQSSDVEVEVEGTNQTKSQLPSYCFQLYPSVLYSFFLFCSFILS